jgi:hypothetical protein
VTIGTICENVAAADLTIWFGDDMEACAARAVIRPCEELGRPCVRVMFGFTPPRDLAKRLRSDGVATVHVDWESEANALGCGGRAESFLRDSLREILSVDSRLEAEQARVR